MQQQPEIATRIATDGTIETTTDAATIVTTAPTAPTAPTAAEDTVLARERGGEGRGIGLGLETATGKEIGTTGTTGTTTDAVTGITDVKDGVVLAVVHETYNLPPAAAEAPTADNNSHGLAISVEMREDEVCIRPRWQGGTVGRRALIMVFLC